MPQVVLRLDLLCLLTAAVQDVRRAGSSGDAVERSRVLAGRRARARCLRLHRLVLVPDRHDCLARARNLVVDVASLLVRHCTRSALLGRLEHVGALEDLPLAVEARRRAVVVLLQALLHDVVVRRRLNRARARLEVLHVGASHIVACLRILEGANRALHARNWYFLQGNLCRGREDRVRGIAQRGGLPAVVGLADAVMTTRLRAGVDLRT